MLKKIDKNKLILVLLGMGLGVLLMVLLSVIVEIATYEPTEPFDPSECRIIVNLDELEVM